MDYGGFVEDYMGKFPLPEVATCIIKLSLKETLRMTTINFIFVVASYWVHFSGFTLCDHRNHPDLESLISERPECLKSKCSTAAQKTGTRSVSVPGSTNCRKGR